MNDRTNINLVKESHDIVTIVSRYIELKKSGANYMGRCPFHSEKTPSFVVSPSIQRYKCFGCGKSGDLITFVQELEGIEFYEALVKLAKEVGIEIEKDKPKDQYWRLREMNKESAEIFYRNLFKPEWSPAAEYLKNRGISGESAKKFKIGYAPPDNSLISKFSRFPKSELELSGLFKINERSGSLADKFKNRIMFPIKSKSGDVVGFSGRLMPNIEFGPKYLNSPDTPIFHKSEHVFGIYESKNQIRLDDLCIIVEGQADVVTAHQIGIKNIVAPLGTSLTVEQLNLIKGLSQNILFIFDNDNAGQAALVKAFELASSLDLNSFAYNCSPYKDFDELIQGDPERAMRVKDEKVEAFEYLMKSEYEKFDPTDLESRNGLLERARELIKSSTDREKTTYYKESFQRVFGFEIVIKDEAPIKDNFYSGQHMSQPEPKKIRRSNSEAYLLGLLIIFPELLNEFSAMGIDDETLFEEPELRELFFKRVKHSDDSPLSTEGEALLDKIVFRLDQLVPKTVAPKEEFQKSFQIVRLKRLEKNLSELRKKLELEDDIEGEYLQQISVLTNEINKLKRE